MTALDQQSQVARSGHTYPSAAMFHRLAHAFIDVLVVSHVASTSCLENLLRSAEVRERYLSVTW
jgi:hypothetical protein